MSTVYKIITTVKDLEFKKRALKVTADRTVPEKPIFHWTYEDMGWFVNFDGSYESLFVGRDRPMDLEPGTEVEILIRPRGK